MTITNDTHTGKSSPKSRGPLSAYARSTSRITWKKLLLLPLTNGK
jgi:hypothetical protein